MNRRDFLKLTALAIALRSGMPNFLARAAALADGERTLVVVQLSGGNDGLNTLVPYSSGAYYAARPTIAIPKREIIPLDEELGMHPNLRQLAALYDDGDLAWIESVGYPNANRSHFASMAIWYTADLGAAREGWISRIVERVGDPFCATYLGSSLPGALRGGEATLPAIDDLASFRLELPDAVHNGFQAILDLPRNAEAAFIEQSTRKMLLDSKRLQQRAARYRPAVSYPNTSFARKLQEAATLIATGNDERVIYLTLGGFDTHAGQRSQQDRLLSTLAAGLSAFQNDLRAQGLDDKVLILAFSEFGRRVAENGSAGTDHGEGGVMLALGKAVRGGIHGSIPDLENLHRGDLRYQQDFRGVYARALDRWLGVPSREVLGADFEGPDFV